MTGIDKWISPSAAMDMLYNDPAESAGDFGFALMRPRSKNKANSVADLARAKLQPREPTKTEQLSSKGWPVTAHAHRMILAPGVAEVGDLATFFHAYDDQRHARLNPLAVVLTLRFGRDERLHDAMTEASTYLQMIVSRQRRISTLLVQHAPGQELSWRAHHLHAVLIPQVHLPSGFCEVHPIFTGDETDMHLTLRDEWRSFREKWRTIRDE